MLIELRWLRRAPQTLSLRAVIVFSIENAKYYMPYKMLNMIFVTN